ncbi:hypothetical protein, partial [Salmonella enterica]
VIKPLLPFYGAIIGVLLLITYIPKISFLTITSCCNKCACSICRCSS